MCQGNKIDKSQNTSKTSLFLSTIRADACRSYRHTHFPTEMSFCCGFVLSLQGCLGIHFLFLKCTQSASQLTGLETSSQGICLGLQHTKGQQQKASAEAVRAPGYQELSLVLTSLRQLCDNISEVFWDVLELKTSPFFMLHGETASLFPP